MAGGKGGGGPKPEYKGGPVDWETGWPRDSIGAEENGQ